ncbi:MAG TPA: hypothetical protein VMS21_00275, partial [Methylomirabilota bacterium]|nr:hypothetical protein [Methylomirabilota bacterium]
MHRKPISSGESGSCRRLWLTAWVGVVLCGGFWSEAANWRVFNKTTDGLSESHTVAVTVSPRGNVLARHGEGGTVSLLDGYSVETLPSPGQGLYPVYESRTGQKWTLYAQGLQVLRDGRWERRPVESIRLEMEANPLRRVRPLPLIPLDHDNVLCLLSDRLIEYSLMRNEVRLIRRAEATGLGRFLDMTEARNGGVWVSGAKGLAKLPGPARRLEPSSEW